MKNSQEPTDIKDIPWTTWYIVSVVLAFFCFFFTSEAEGVEMLGVLGGSIMKAIFWPVVVLSNIFS